MAVKFKDYYEILDVPRASTPDEIRLAYRLLARQFQPDIAKDKAARFKVDGADLYTQLEVTPREAVLGAQIAFQSLDGRMNVRIPAGSHSGQKLRRRALGMPVGKGTRGDLYLRLHVQVPTFVSDDERVLWKKLAQSSTFNPRK